MLRISYDLRTSTCAQICSAIPIVVSRRAGEIYEMGCRLLQPAASIRLCR